MNETIVRPEWLSHEVWPHPLEAVDTPAGAVSVTDTGDGPAALLVHVGFWSLVWRDLIAHLTPSFRCVTLDAPGTGLSHRPGPEGVTLAAAADAITAVVRSFQLDDLVLVLHDLGGPAGLAAASEWPDRVRGIVAVNTFGWRPEGTLFRTMLAVMGSTLLEGADALTGFLPRMTATRFGVGRRLDRDAKRVFRLGIDRDGRRSFHRYMRGARREDALFARVERTLRGPLADRPLLTVFGERNDPLDFQPRWRERFPEARRLVVPGGLHFPMCDAPELVAESVATWHREEVEAATS